MKGRAIREVDKIIHNKSLTPPQNFALASAWVLADFKGINLKILDVRETSSLADYYVLASAQSTTTARAMAESIQLHFKRHQAPLAIEGLDNAKWILLDCQDIIVHIFQESIRSIFDLDDLWKDSPLIPIPQEYYLASHNKEKTEEAEAGDESADSYL